jgi:hypothetical protein
VADIAIALAETRHAVERVKDAFEEGGADSVQRLQWGAGAPCKNKALKEELDWLVDPGTLKT